MPCSLCGKVVQALLSANANVEALVQVRVIPDPRAVFISSAACLFTPEACVSF